MDRNFKYGERVVVSAWGWNVRQSDVRRTGTVSKVNRTTVSVFWDDKMSGPHTTNIRPELLNRIG